uniref:Tyrosine-protein kinase n=1 Tax=Trichuris muris TaxID=70415 RepID=A0A5S6QUS9_TRIMR
MSTPIHVVSESRRGNLIKDTLAHDPIFAEFYFYGLLPREDVELMLLHDGEFLVRQTKKICMEASGAVISVRWKGEVVHIVILKHPTGFLLEDKIFPTVRDLVTFYQAKQFPVTKESGAVLKTAIHRADWVLHESQIMLIEKLGEGQFGEVWKAELTKDSGRKEVVAVKTLKAGEVPKAEQKLFFDECRRQRQLRHPHLVNFKGVSLESTIMLVMELCDTTLLKYLKKYQNIMTLREHVKLMVHASRGMVYLASEKCIHRDLAARNCLIRHGRLKIADLGMARTGDMYKMHQSRQKPLPVKWIPPDTLMSRNYTEKSDVWAFGVLMWEILTNGESPYAELALNTTKTFVIELITFLRQGKRLTPPPNTPDELKSLMMKCWDADPDKRPKFVEIAKRLDDIYFGLTDKGGMVTMASRVSAAGI